MKNLILLSLICISFEANAFMNIKAIVLKNSTVIKGEEISAITVKDEDNSIQSVELKDGSEIRKNEIRSLKFKFNPGVRAVKKVGGEGSGG